MRRADGFTLVELVMVIVLLGIVATISVQFVSLSTRGALDVSSRLQRSLAGVVISEKISREVREALPTSIRTNASGTCLEWMPILAASNYVDLPRGASLDSFKAVPLPAGASAAGRVAVYGYGSNVYNLTNPGSLSPPAIMPFGASPVTVTFDAGATHRFSAESPERRFYLVGPPVALCQAGRFLYRYQNYGINASPAAGLPSAYPGREVMAATLVNNSLSFQVTPPSLQRGAVVSFSLVLEDTGSGETTAINQEVQVRNVP